MHQADFIVGAARHRISLSRDGCDPERAQQDCALSLSVRSLVGAGLSAHGKNPPKNGMEAHGEETRHRT
jgi:hypothetical protein